MANALQWIQAFPYPFLEVFENPSIGYSSGFTWVESPGTGGSINPKNTSSPILGTQDLKIIGGTIGNQSEDDVNLRVTFRELFVYFKFKVNIGPTTNDNICILLRDSAQSEKVSLYIRPPGNGSTFKLASGGSSSAVTVTTWVAGTVFDVWVHYSANGYGDVGVSTNGVRPTSGNGFASYTGGNTATIQYVCPRAEESCSLQFDRIIASNYLIGDNP